MPILVEDIIGLKEASGRRANLKPRDGSGQ